jgi:hypothetical protein
MRDLALGLFPGFKGADTVLLICSGLGVTKLRELLASPPSFPLPLHAHAEVASNHPVTLFAAANVPDHCGPVWLADAAGLPKIHAGLDSLASARNGHEYFDLANSDAQLIVSLNEYDASWWAANA